MSYRTMPDDLRLRKIFHRHRTHSARWIRDRYGWPIAVNTVQAYQRRLVKSNPIAGAASISHAEFSDRMVAAQERRLAGRVA